MLKFKISKLIPLLSVPLLLPLLAFGSLAAQQEPVQLEASYAPYQIPNGGFESGNLDGWTVYRLWKDESGMAAFDASLVTNGTYFGSNPYGREGSYNLGITSGSITWDQSSERMGYLRSANFVLGGSGWISFKLGGGKYEEFAHVSLRKVSDNTEVARFGNRFFNNTGRATTVYGSSISNAEAFLFPYYFDLSTLVSLGTNLYIVLVDASAYDWSILSADSFVTYYAPANEPNPSADELAVNILPTIDGVGSPTNSIPNGNFDSDYAGWSISGATGWGRVDNAMKSNATGGDASLGVLRSSAFVVTDNKYVRFDWAGGLKWDKQIFVSVKEVGSNIEVLRFVRRENLSTKGAENYDNHMLNLSTLSSSKSYYLEFADARSGDWGVSFVDTIRIVPETEWNSVVEGDRAVSISGIPTSFAPDSVQEAAAYAAYFLEQTAPVCEAMSGDFSSVWSTLATEYGTLSGAAKDYFTNSGTSEPTVVAARTRYVFIIEKYTALTRFVVDSSDVVYLGAPDIVGYDMYQSSTLTIVIITGVLILASGMFLIIRRRKIGA